jgi:Family of unknown function (DUF6384)
MSDAAVAEASAPAPKLDELMLAMDVVDTLRHDLRLVEREFSAASSDEALIKRLREVYQSQGIKVPDRILEEGVKALNEKRFSYEPPGPSLARSRSHGSNARGSARSCSAFFLQCYASGSPMIFLSLGRNESRKSKLLRSSPRFCPKRSPPIMPMF